MSIRDIISTNMHLGPLCSRTVSQSREPATTQNNCPIMPLLTELGLVIWCRLFYTHGAPDGAEDPRPGAVALPVYRVQAKKRRALFSQI